VRSGEIGAPSSPALGEEGVGDPPPAEPPPGRPGSVSGVSGVITVPSSVAAGVSPSTVGPVAVSPVVTFVSGELGAAVSLATDTTGVEPSDSGVITIGATDGSGGATASGAIESFATGADAIVSLTDAPEISGAVSLEIIVSFVGAAAPAASSVTGVGAVVEPGASVPGSIPTPVSVAGPVLVAFGTICCGVPV
jgi:hypothetical protein